MVCCRYNYKDCSSAYTVVKSSVQSVAKAHAEAYAEAIATVSDCFKGYAGDLLAYSSAIAEVSCSGSGSAAKRSSSSSSSSSSRLM
jgi:hypothetical protein